MRKYGKKYIKKENKYKKKEDKNDDFLDSLIRKKINNMGIDINTYSNEEFKKKGQVLNTLLYYSKMPNTFRNWYDKEILESYNKKELFSLALKKLTYKTYANEKKEIKTIIKSLRLTKIVDDIFYNSKERNFIIKTKNGKYDLSPISETYDGALNSLGYCHPLTEEYAKINKGIDVACGYYEDSLYNNRYHSIAINKKTNEIIDVAHNIRTDVGLYLNELNYKIIMQEEAEDYFKNLKELKINDSKFRKSNLYNLLKYTINKQIKLEQLNKAAKKKIFH